MSICCDVQKTRIHNSGVICESVKCVIKDLISDAPHKTQNRLGNQNQSVAGMN